MAENAYFESKTCSSATKLGLNSVDLLSVLAKLRTMETSSITTKRIAHFKSIDLKVPR